MVWVSAIRWLAAAVVCLAATAVQASQITLTTDAPPGSPVALAAGSVSGIVVAKVFNDVGADPTASQMAGWQFRLTIVPEAGATGTVSFILPASGTASNPSNYVFGGAGSGILVINGSNQISANDVHDLSGSGASQVPVAPGANLLALGISVSANASGKFGIYAIQGSANTVWTDNAANPQTRFFTNVPNGTGTVLIGEVSVPEPGSMAVLGGVMMLLATRRRPR